MASKSPENLSDEGTENCCLTKIVYGKCYIVWEINNFSYCRQSTGEFLSSCIFSSDDPGAPKFRVDLYPRGTSHRPEDIVVGIRLITDKDDVRTFVSYKFFIYKNQKSHYQRNGEIEMRPDVRSHQVNLANRQELYRQKDELLPKDTLVLVCVLRWPSGEDTSRKEGSPLKSRL